MNPQNSHCYINNWLIDIQSGSIIHRQTGEQKRLGEYQLKLLEVLSLHAGEVLTREQLTHLVWEGRVIGNNSLPNAVHALRLALEDNGKNQRVIKTIPKRGYLLDKEYCSFINTEIKSPTTSSESDLPDLLHSLSDEISVDVNKSAFTNLPAVLPITTKTAPSATTPLVFRKAITYGLFILCLISIGISSYVYFIADNTPRSTFVTQKIETVKLNNISIYHVMKNSQLTSHKADPDKISERLEPTLIELDSQLAQTHSKMYVYYRMTDSVLNYAFTIESPCGNKELSMNIHHWRINNDRLNNLIRSESERKLNETAICNN